MAAFKRYNVRASGADGSPLYFPNITIWDNDSLDAYAARLAGANVRLLSAELIGSSASEALAPVFQDVIRTLPVGVPAGPPMEYEIIIDVLPSDPAPVPATQGNLLFYGVIAVGIYFLLR